MVPMENFEQAEKLLKDGIETIQQAKDFVELLRGKEIKDKTGKVWGRRLSKDEEYGTAYISIRRYLDTLDTTVKPLTRGEIYLSAFVDGMAILSNLCRKLQRIEAFGVSPY